MWQKFDWLLVGALILILPIQYFSPSEIGHRILVGLSIIAIIPIAKSAYQSIIDRQIATDLLASIALTASFLAGEWTSAAFINLMLTAARLFGDYTDQNARRAIRSLLDLRPKTVRIQTETGIVVKPQEQVIRGDLVVISLGERIPIDGTIVEGSSLIDQSSLTGESLPIPKTIGDTVLSSSLNTGDTLVVRAEKVGADTTLEKIIRLVETSQTNKVQIQTIANHFANWYIGSVLVLSLGIYLATANHTLVLAFLLIACADDIAVAIPLAFSASIGQATKLGIIIKGPHFLEGLAQADTVFFDKTGTLTTGKIALKKITLFDTSKTEKEVLALAASLENTSTHPLAQAIVSHAKAQQVNFLSLTDHSEHTGKGVQAKLDGHIYRFGNKNFLEENQVTFEKSLFEKETPELMHTITLFLTRDTSPIAAFSLADTPRVEAKDALENLRQLGLAKQTMLTGDTSAIAQYIASQTGIREFQANLLPEDKVRIVQEALHPAGKVIMVGDGINDAAALAQADIGIAMGAIGSDIAIETADIALMNDRLDTLAQAIRIGKRTLAISRQNFWIWGLTNIVGLILVFSGFIGPSGAAAYNFMTDFIPIASSFRIFRMKV